MFNSPALSLVKSVHSRKTVEAEATHPFSKILEGKQNKCPYSFMAQDGIVEHNGVVFVCDFKTNALCLGDMSDPKKVLDVHLPSGGTLRVNVNNFGELAKAADMFSPEDLNAIMRAIAQYNHCTRKLNEIDEEKEEGIEEATSPNEEAIEHEQLDDRLEDENILDYNMFIGLGRERVNYEY